MRQPTIGGPTKVSVLSLDAMNFGTATDQVVLARLMGGELPVIPRAARPR